jgi:hypothetical protein
MTSMSRRIVVATILLLGVGTALFSQETMSIVNGYLDKLRRDNFMAPNETRMQYKDIDGTPYLSESFSQGILYMKAEIALEGEFRFDIYANQIEFRKDEHTYTIGQPDSIERLVMGDMTLMYQTYIDEGVEKSGYFILLAEGDYSLFEQKSKVFKAASPPKPYQDQTIPARFENGTDRIFISHNQNPAVKVASTKEIISFCGSDGNIARDYIEKQKTKFKDRKDLVNLIDHLNQSKQK